MPNYTQEQYEKDKADLARSRQDPKSFVFTPNIMIIRGEAYPTDQPLWHNGDGKTPKVEEPPRQSPDIGGVMSTQAHHSIGANSTDSASPTA